MTSALFWIKLTINKKYFILYKNLSALILWKAPYWSFSCDNCVFVLQQKIMRWWFIASLLCYLATVTVATAYHNSTNPSSSNPWLNTGCTVNLMVQIMIVLFCVVPLVSSYTSSLIVHELEGVNLQWKPANLISFLANANERRCFFSSPVLHTRWNGSLSVIPGLFSLMKTQKNVFYFSCEAATPTARLELNKPN